MTAASSAARLGREWRRRAGRGSEIDLAREHAQPRRRVAEPLYPPAQRSARLWPLAELLAPLVPEVGNHVILDKTGLTGGFNAELTWTPDASLGNSHDTPSPASDGPSLFTAMQEQLGLKLDPQRGPVEVLVIDSVEHATED